jgi:hypothetical protein
MNTHSPRNSVGATLGSPVVWRRLQCAAALLGLAAVPLAGCSHRAAHGDAEATASSSAPVAASASAAARAPTAPAKRVYAPSRPDCQTVEVLAAGEAAGRVCVDDAAHGGLTVVDLSDQWTPRVFAPDPVSHDAPEYRAKYLELANAASADLGLNGIAPSLSLLGARLSDDKRRTCDAAIELAPLSELLATLSAAADDRARAATLRAADAKPALRAAAAELACAGLLKPSLVTGALGPSMQVALDAFRRRHMIVGASLDGDTLAALALGGDELAFRGLLRGLRERVADAAGLVEDGSASGEQLPVAGRQLDLSRFAPREADGSEALDGAATDLVDAATDVAARELGWTSPDAARSFFAARGKDGLRALEVAVALPPAPKYHSASMDLRVEIDRGDVFYETPGRAAVERSKLASFRGPRFVVYAKDGDRERPLIRWATTIGGWKKERTEEGEIALKYKESDVGERVWRQIVAAPAWLPPDSTPETDLLREAKDGSFALKRDLIQPGYGNAYGLVMLIHEEAVAHGSQTRWADHGIRTHGSVDYRSITRGESHGCHRLYNQLALRLSGYLLQHRPVARRGTMRVGFHRTLDWNDQSVELDVPNRGYLYELDPPVPVRVLTGRIAGEAQKPMASLIHLPPAEPPAEPKKG